MVQALGLASFAASSRNDLKRIFTGAPDTKLRRPDDLRLPTSGSQDAWRKICCGQWEGPCPACGTGDDRLRLMLDGTIWCRICTPDGDPVAFANLCEAKGLPMPGARGGDMKLALVIVEASELAGLYSAEIEALKAFLSRQDDGGVRLSWRRNRCLPNGPTGLRRFAPVPLDHGCDVLAHLQPVRAQLWAEALAWWRQGGQSAALPRTLILARGRSGRSGRTETRIAAHMAHGIICSPSPDRRTL